MTALLLVVQLAAAQTPPPPPSQSAADAVAAQTPRPNAVSGFHGLASLDTAVGSGTFANAAYYASVSTALTLDGRYGLAVGQVPLSFGARTGASYELTTPDAVSAARVGFPGFELLASSPELLRTADGRLFFTPSLTVSPLDPILVLALPFGVQLRGDARLEFFRFALVVGAGTAVPIGQTCPGATCRSLATPRYLLDVLGRAEWRPFEALSFGAALGLNHRWRNVAAWDPSDPYNPRGTQVNGEPVANIGYGASRSTVGELYAAYRFNPIFGASFAILTDGPLLTNDSKAIRFPFYDFLSPGNSLTTFTFAVFARSHDIIEPRWFAP